jgi:hypothetical protein
MSYKDYILSLDEDIIKEGFPYMGNCTDVGFVELPSGKYVLCGWGESGPYNEVIYENVILNKTRHLMRDKNIDKLL